MMARTALLVTAAALAPALGCADDPLYVQPAEALEVGAPESMQEVAETRLILPVRLEREDEATERAELAAELGVEVPYVRLEDMSVSIEWTIKNLSETEGTARLFVNGGNEWFYYVPLNFVFDPDEDEEPPPLMGDVPLAVPPNGTRSGVFREDQLREASVDLELITRGATNPFAAMVRTHRSDEEIPDGSGGTVPRAALGHLVQLDVAFTADRHMVLEYAVRVRDHRGLLHEELLEAPAGELTQFAPAEFTPPPPAE